MQEKPKSGEKSKSRTTDFPIARTSIDTEIHLDLLVNSLALVEQFNRGNSMSASLERISAQATIQNLVYQNPDADKSDLDKTSKNISKNTIEPYIHNIKQYCKDTTNSPTGATLDYFLSEAIKIERMRQNYEAEQVVLFNGTNLNQIGLSLELITTNSDRILVVADQTYIPQNLAFNLENGGKFISFLSELSQPDMINSSLGNYLETISTSLASQLLKQYDLFNPNNETIELIIYLEKINSEYQRLGLKGKSLLLSDLSELKKAGILREYISAFRSDLLTQDQSLPTPEHWPFLYQSENFLQKWNGVLDTLREIKKNPKAIDLYKQIRQKLFKYIESSRLQIESTRPKNINTAPIYLSILFTIREELEDM